MRRYRIEIDIDDLIRRYVGGESEKSLAEAFGVSRSVITRCLVKSGIERRGRSAAMYARMANTSPEDRAALATAAHDAVRGKPKSEDFLLARAAGVERVGRDGGNVSVAELMIGDSLRTLGLPVIHQKAIGPYNVDLATGSVAVEVLGGGWHRTKSHGERLRYILDAGWDVVFIWVDGIKYPLGPGATEYVAAHAQFRDRNPSAGRCYRVIRGGGQFVAGGSADGDDLPDVVPITDRPNQAPTEVPFGQCHCGCGGTTKISAKSSTAKGWIRGEPRRFISGHNHSG